jgi:hypothetical protein
VRSTGRRPTLVILDGEFELHEVENCELRTGIVDA